MEAHYRRLQRATVARSALDVIALVFLACAFAFWSVAFWQLLSPPALLSLWSVQAVVLALVYALATPLLWSMLVPTTPAGQLLQKTQLRTVGFAFIVAAAIYLSIQAEWMIESWLYAQPAIAESGMARSLAISLSIAFILIPALAWVQLTPERWLQQIQQAHQVKKLEMQQRGELAIIKASLIRAETLAAIGWANLLPVEREEAVSSLRGLLMGSADSMRAVVRTLGLDAELSRSIMGDEEIADQLDYVTKAIDIVPDVAPTAITRMRDLPAHETARAINQAFDQAIAKHAPSPSERATAAPVPYTKPHERARAADRPGQSRTIPHDGEYTIAYERFGSDGWTVKDLAAVLSIAPETAAKRRAAWLDAGLITGKGQSNGRYRFI